MDYQPKDLLPVLKKLTEKYTSKSSTSVSYDTAGQLMGAILYCINENSYGKNGEKTTTLRDTAKSVDAQISYENGYALVVSKIKEAHLLYNRIMNDFNSYGSRAYEDTMVGGLPEFFKWYDPRFAPKNHIILMDYHVLSPLSNLTGIDLIYEYLHCVYWEQLFLSHFPKQYVRNVLLHYHRDYSELFENIAEIVLQNILINLLLEMETPVIKFNISDSNRLSEIVINLNKESLTDSLLSELNFFIAGQFASNQDLNDYLGQAVQNLAAVLINAAENNCMETVLGGNLYG